VCKIKLWGLLSFFAVHPPSVSDTISPEMPVARSLSAPGARSSPPPTGCILAVVDRASPPMTVSAHRSQVDRQGGDRHFGGRLARGSAVATAHLALSLVAHPKIAVARLIIMFALMWQEVADVLVPRRLAARLDQACRPGAAQRHRLDTRNAPRSGALLREQILWRLSRTAGDRAALLRLWAARATWAEHGPQRGHRGSECAAGRRAQRADGGGDARQAADSSSA